MHRGIGIRSHKDILRRADKPSPTLDWLRGEIDTRFERHRQQYQFLAGARSLGQLKQRLGHMSESRRIALAGVLEQRISWFLVHSGFTRSAISHASLSLWLLQSAHYRLGSTEEVREFIRSTLIAAHANLLAARPAAALQILDLMRAASESIGAPLGSDYYRQRGIAFFQLGNMHDDEAKASFAQSERQMRKLGEGESEAQVLMTGTRHINLLGKPDWDGALRVMEMAENTFRSDSLEASMIQNLVAYDAGLDTLLSEARKFGICVVSANQFLEQYPALMRAAIMAVGTHVFFQLSSIDADKMANSLDGGKRLTELLKNLPKRHMVIKTGSRHPQEVLVSNTDTVVVGRMTLMRLFIGVISR
jgi:hypothetical protein